MMNSAPEAGALTSAQRQIYVDHAATTPVAPEVLEAMLPYFSEFYGNPSSIHRLGRRANVALENARRSIAGLFGAKAGEIVFTGCGSESDNAALRGIAHARRARTGATRIVTTPIEHQAVLDDGRGSARPLWLYTDIAPGRQCRTHRPGSMRTSAGRRQRVALVSVMLANNEVGTIQPVAEVGTAVPGTRRAAAHGCGPGRGQAAAAG